MMGKSQRVRVRDCAGFFVAATSALCISTGDASGEEIATCGNSHGYGYYPKAGLGALSGESGKWIEDGISSGKFTLTQTSDTEFDLLFTDTTGRVVSTKQDGGFVVLTGATQGAISVVVIYPATAVAPPCLEVHITSASPAAFRKKVYAAPIMKVTAMRADCSFFAF